MKTRFFGFSLLFLLDLALNIESQTVRWLSLEDQFFEEEETRDWQNEGIRRGAYDVQSRFEIDLCSRDFADIHGDSLCAANQALEYRISTEKCQKNFTIIYLQPTRGYMVEAFQGEFDGGKPIDILGFQNGTQRFTFPPGVISVRITRMVVENAASYHQMFTTKSEYLFLSDPSMKETLGAGHLFPTGDRRKYVLFQASPTNDGTNGIEMRLDGDCGGMAIWKGLVQSEATKIYGDQVTMCGRRFNRDTKPNLVFDRYLIVETRGQQNCSISWFTHKYDQNRDTIWVYNNYPGLLTSPPYSGPAAIIGEYMTTYNLVKMNEVKQIYIDLLAPLAGDATFSIIETQKNNTATTFGSEDKFCNFTSESDLKIIYTWSCASIPCDNGIIFRQSSQQVKAIQPSASNIRSLFVSGLILLSFWFL